VRSCDRKFRSYQLLIELVPQVQDQIIDPDINVQEFSEFMIEVRILFISFGIIWQNKSDYSAVLSSREVQMMPTLMM